MIADARSLLFVPGDRPERFGKARGAGADLVVLDLEDAVAPESKAAARANVVGDLRVHPGQVVRINAVGSPGHDEDMAVLAQHARMVMLPKAEDARVVAALIGRLPAGVQVVALVETARGIHGAAAIAEVPGVSRLAFGSLDLAAELGVAADDREAMLVARGALVLASAAAGIAPPLDGVTTSVGDEKVLASDLEYARRMGFGGKLCIHPSQVGPVISAFSPSSAELDWADRVCRAAAAAGGGAVLLDGAMVDKPVVDRARRVLAARRAN